MNRSLIIAGLLAANFALGACASLVAPSIDASGEALRAGDYRLDKRHAALLFRINHLGFSDYVGRFEEFDASLTFDPNAPQTAQVDAIINVASLDVADDDFAETLLSEGWLNAGAHPSARFRSASVTVTGENAANMQGELTLNGVTAPVTLDVRFRGGARDLLRGGYVVGFSASGAFDRTTFGVDKFAGVIDDMIRIEIEAEFIRQ